MVKEKNIGFVVADSSVKWPLIREVTSDFLYMRLHGLGEQYENGYSNQMPEWVEFINDLLKQKREKCSHLFVYFDNESKTTAPYDAMELARLICNE